MTVIEPAYAKINLFLDVTGRREDGFHDILRVMHSVSLCDYLTVSCKDSHKTTINLSSSDKTLPCDENNIVYRAVYEFLSYYNIKAEVDVRIDKNIPIGAGLGGGSSDGAAVLRAMNRVYNVASETQLLEISSKIGSDVPFCLCGGLCLCSGRGERLTRIDSFLNSYFVIAIGDKRVSTPKAYAELDRKYNNFIGSHINENRSKSQSKMADFLDNKKKTIPFYNIFEEVTKISEVDKIKEIMIKNGAEYAMMSGSGPSVFGIISNEPEANSLCRILIENGYIAFVSSSVYPEV